MKTKVLLTLFWMLFITSCIYAQKKNKHSVYAPILSWDVINPNLFQSKVYLLKSLGYQYHFNAKWAAFIQGHHKAGKYRESSGDAVRGGDLLEWNGKIGVERKWKLSNRWSILSQLACFKEKYRIDNGFYDYLGRRNWNKNLNWVGAELNVGIDFKLTDHFSLFILHGFKAGTGEWVDSLFSSADEPTQFSIGMEWPIIENFGIKYIF